MGETWQLVGLLALMFLGGWIITFNTIPALGLSWGGSAISMFFTILARIFVGPIMMILPIYVLWNLIRG